VEIADYIARLVENANGDDLVKLKFYNRLSEGKLTRSQNPTSHVCVFFPAYDPLSRSIFVGLHKKSRLWLVNGGHMDEHETPADTVVREAKEEWGLSLIQTNIPNPSLVTLTEIEHPELQICEWHYDLWHFLAFNKDDFHPLEANVSKEFSDYGWKSYDEAKLLLSDPNSLSGISFLETH
jgi:8-oxo-dGTP pyrophosphatase MutT (NUDIX family)